MFQSMVPLLIGALLAGFMGSPHCVGMCGGFATASSKSWGDALGYHLGRLVTYGLMGGGIATLFDELPVPAEALQVVAVGMLLWFAARLAGVITPLQGEVGWITQLGGRVMRLPGVSARFAFGAVTGLLPCGLVYAALAMAVAAGDGATGALTMVAFGLGTIPALAFSAAGLRRLRTPTMRRLVALAVVVVGIGSVFLRGPVGL